MTARVDYRLAAHHILKILEWYVDIGENFEIRAPLYARAGVFFIIRLLYHITYGLAALEIQMIAKAV